MYLEKDILLLHKHLLKSLSHLRLYHKLRSEKKQNSNFQMCLVYVCQTQLLPALEFQSCLCRQLAQLNNELHLYQLKDMWLLFAHPLNEMI